MKQPLNETVIFRLRPELRELLQALAPEGGSLGAVIRKILAEHVGKPELARSQLGRKP